MDGLELEDGQNTLQIANTRSRGLKPSSVMITAYDQKDKMLVNFWLKREDAIKVINHLQNQFQI